MEPQPFTQNITSIAAQYWNHLFTQRGMVRIPLYFNNSMIGSATNLSTDPTKNYCIIGTKTFQSDNSHNLPGILFHIAHEFRHVYQQQCLYQKPKPNKLEIAMWRMDAIAQTFQDYYTATYPFSLSEIDANLWALGNITSDQTNDLLEPFGIDIEQNLLNYLQTVPEATNYNTISSLGDYQQQLLYQLNRNDEFYRTNPLMSNTRENQLIYQHLKKHAKSWIPILENFNKPGFEADEELFAAVMDINTTWIDPFSAFDEEKDRIRSLYPPKVKSHKYRGAAFYPNQRKCFGLSAEEQKLFDMAEAVEAKVTDDYEPQL